MPAEWEPHDACYMAWPCRPETWLGLYAEAKAAYAGVAAAIGRFETVVMLAPPALVGEARSSLPAGVEVISVELDDSWVRDCGPIFVRRAGGDRAIVHFRFNGWGGKFPWTRDDRVSARISEQLGLRRYDAPMVLEGGAISVDGAGTLLTTEQCLLNPNRNPSLSRGQIEKVLLEFLGARKVVWLREGLKDDLTDGHVDGVASFTAPHVVTAAYPEESSDPNHGALADNLARLEAATDAKGHAIEVVKLPQPRPRTFRGIPLTPGYVNHYFANGGLIVPTYGLPEDREALDILRALHSDLEVVGVPATHIEIAGGSVHCITQQRPA